MNEKNTFRRVALIIGILALVLMIFFGLRVLKQTEIESNQKNDEIEALHNEIKSEEEKQVELKKNQNQNITDKDYEELARDELGLIKKDEIVIKPR